MLKYDSPEYRELERHFELWESLCADSEHRARTPESVEAAEGMLRERDAAYEAYRTVFGDPTGKELLAMDEHYFHVFITTGGHYLLLPLYRALEKYGVFTQDIDTMEYCFSPEVTPREVERQENALKMIAPHWSLGDIDQMF